MTTYHYILFVLFSGLTGWLTVYLALYILLYPEKPIGLAGIQIQGILPSYKKDLAEMLADTFTREFFGSAVLKETISSPALFEKLKPEIESHVDLFLREKLKVHFPMLSMLVGEKTISQLKNAFMTELEGLFPTVMNSYLGNLNSSDTKKIITQGLTGIPLKNTPVSTNKTLQKLFIRLQLAGILVGLTLGCLQALVLMLLS